MSNFPVTIQIWDADDAPNKDDLGDASPVSKKSNLDFIVDRVTGKWSGDIVWPQNCAQGEVNSDEPRVEVCFEVSVISKNGDIDGDGLLDGWEQNGFNNDGDGSIEVDLPAMGANPLHKDIFLEFDWMTGQNPTRQAIQAIKTAFAAAPINAGGIPNPDGQPGVNLWVDTGNLTDPKAAERGSVANSCSDGSDNDGDGLIDRVDPDCLVGDNLGGGNAVTTPNTISGLNKSFYIIKQNNVKSVRNPSNPSMLPVPIRSKIFHYGLSAAQPSNNKGISTGSNSTTTLNDTLQNWIPDEWIGRTVTITAGTGSSQTALIVKSNTATQLVTSTNWARTPDKTSTYTISLTGGQGELGGNDFIEYNHDSGAIMHELGHNLNLQHGGNDGINCKPNYVSVMNYDNQFGIQQNTGGSIIDYSPPRFPGGRGNATLPSLTENNLNEATILDATDTANQFIYTRGAAGKFSSSLNQRVDWNGDGDTNDSGITFNLNQAGMNGSSTACATNTSNNETLNGYDDWKNIKLKNFSQFADSESAAINPVREPEPTLEDNRLLQEELNTTDLEIIKSDSLDMAVAGQELIYTLTVKNNGPRLARNVQVVDILPKHVTHISNTASCVIDSSGKLTCNLSELRVNETKEIQIKVHIAADLPCKKDDQFFTLTNNANVVNLSGPDSKPSNNESSKNTQVLCIKYEYAAKIICGIQKNSENMSFARGFYATSINIHNPNDEKVHFFKKLALAYPPEEQKPGSVIPIAIDTLEYDEALKTDCNDIQKNLFKGKFPTPYIEGYVVVQSPRSLDVTGVHTTANLGCWGKAKDQQSIDVEQISERKRTSLIEHKPDLVVSKIENINVNCPQGSETCATSVSVTISNIGKADANAFNTKVVFDPAQSLTVNQAFARGIVAGASQSFTITSPPDGNCFDPDCTICVTVDSENNVSESEEANNELCESKSG
jgi:uncharacterized repeat protein (TIGR01451 family)